MFPTIIPPVTTARNRPLARLLAAGVRDTLDEATVGLLLRIPGEVYASPHLATAVATTADRTRACVLWRRLALIAASGQTPLTGTARGLLLACADLAGASGVPFQAIGARLDDDALTLLRQAIRHAMPRRSNWADLDTHAAAAPGVVMSDYTPEADR